MHVKVTKADLSKALGIIQTIVSPKTTMPILMNVLLSAKEDGELRLTASDLEVNALVKVKAEVLTPGSTTLNAKIFSDIVRELPEAAITLKLSDGERVQFLTQTSSLKMLGVASEEYPSLAGIALTPKNRVPARLLVEMLERTMYAMSSDESRINLNGVYLESVKGSKPSAIRMTATDGHRLAFVTRPGHGFELESGIILPRKGLPEIRKMLENEIDRDVLVGVEEGYFVVESPGGKIAVQLADAEFPDCSQVLPKTKGIIARMDGPALCQALRLVALMVSDKSKCVRLDFSPNALRISGQSAERGEAVEELPIEYSGSVLSIGYNSTYLIDAASSIRGDQKVRFEIHGELGPALISADGDEASVNIVMPMRLP